MADAKPIGLDGAGFDILRNVILTLLNEYPGLGGREILYRVLDVDSGISMEPESGALVYAEQKDILGGTSWQCQFPFFVVYRSAATSESQKMSIDEFLDTLGAWLCKEPVTIDGVACQLEAYPDLTGGRRITEITRFNPYALEPNQNNTQDCVLPITVKYTHEFNMW